MGRRDLPQELARSHRDGLREPLIDTEARVEQAILDERSDTATIVSSSPEGQYATLGITDASLDGGRMTCQVSGSLDSFHGAVVTEGHYVGDDVEIDDLAVAVNAVAQFLLTMSWGLVAGSTDPVDSTMSQVTTAMDVDTNLHGLF